MTATKITSMRTGVVAIILLSLVFVPLFQSTQAQNVIAFTPDDKFNIPELQGCISFALNGSYSSAVLDNSTWVFNDLVLNNSQNMGTLKVSTKNSNITIADYLSFNILGGSRAITFLVEGQGVQTLNFDLNYTKPTDASEWMVIISPTIFLSEGEGWHLLPDDTVVLTGQTGNVTLFHYHLEFPDNSNLPFYQQHSIALITIVVVAVTVIVAFLISVKVRK